MNLTMTIALYAAICKEQGLPFRCPFDTFRCPSAWKAIVRVLELNDKLNDNLVLSDQHPERTGCMW